MKVRLVILTALLGVFMASAHAMPPMQHRATGMVQVIDRMKSTITIIPNGKSEPETYLVQEGRTRLKCEGRRAKLEEVPVGAQVRLYYRRERGALVATQLECRAMISSTISDEDRNRPTK